MIHYYSYIHTPEQYILDSCHIFEVHTFIEVELVHIMFSIESLGFECRMSSLEKKTFITIINKGMSSYSSD